MAKYWQFPCNMKYTCVHPIFHWSIYHLKVCEFLDAPMLRTCYISLVHPYLDYACVIRCPFQLWDMRVIWKGTKMWLRPLAISLKNKSYYDSLVSLNLPSLLYRRSIDKIMVYMIVRGLKGFSFDRLFTYCDLPTRSHGYKLYKNHCHIRKIFLNRVASYQSLERFTQRY